MRINWKVLIALAIMGATGIWAVTSVRAQTYTGTSLDFRVGRGPVTVTNPSDAPVSVQLVGTGARSFRIASTTEGIAGASTREGTGRSATQLLSVLLPPGVSTFSVTGGTDVTFLSTADTRLSATVQPASQSETQTTLIASAVVVLAALVYLWRTARNTRISGSRSQRSAERRAKQTAEIFDPSPSQGREIRAYGDNRTEVGG